VNGSERPTTTNLKTLTQGKVSIHVLIGEYKATRQTAVMQTVLGSCVAACLYDPIHRVAGMNHILLPGDEETGLDADSSRYGVYAMELLVNEIMKHGGVRACLKAKVFGGGHVLRGAESGSGPGRRNVEFVLKFLEAERIALISQNTGGAFTRRIFFHTDTYDVFVKRIPIDLQGKIVNDEETFRRHLTEEVKKPTDVEFFD